MTEQEKFAEAVRLLEECSDLYDQAEKMFNALGVEFVLDRPICFEAQNPEWKKRFIYKGVQSIADIFDTEVHKTRDYLMTSACGITFYQSLRGQK